MKITTKHEDQYNTHVTVTDDNGAGYEYSIGLHRKGISDKPEDCLLDIYRQMYRDADIQPQENETKLEAWKRWIAEGHTNPEISEEYQEEVSPALYILPEYDDEMIDFRKRDDRRVEVIKVEVDKRKVDRRVLKLEVTPAIFETRKRIIRPEQVIEKVEWVSTHPKTIGLKERIKKTPMDEALKEILLEMI